MKLHRTKLLTLALISALAIAPIAHAANNPPAKTAQTSIGVIERTEVEQSAALLERAVAFLQANGPLKALAAFNERKGAFVSDEYYVFVVGTDGILHASGGTSHSLVGLNVLGLQDAAGKPFIRDMLDMAKTKESGVLEYRWLNQVDNRLENKTDQFRKVGNHIVCVGYYTPRAYAEQARAMLDKAVALVRKSGGKSAFKAFNDPQGGFVIDDEYVFAIGLEDGKYRASGAAPSLVGVDVRELNDAAGKPLFRDMIALAKQKGSGSVEYMWRNPATNAVETKHSLIQRVGAVLLGVGYYTRN